MVRPDGSVERLHRVVLVHELHRLPPVPAGGSRAHPHLFGEHRGVVWSGTVHRGRRLHHNLVQRPRLLGRREELKGADDVDLLHDPPPADPGGRGDDVQVDEGVRLGCLEHFDDQRVPDVGSDEFGSLQVTSRPSSPRGWNGTTRSNRSGALTWKSRGWTWSDPNSTSTPTIDSSWSSRSSLWASLA